MKRAGRVHGCGALGVAVLIALVTWGGIEGYGTLRAAALVESLKTASTAEVPPIIEQLAGYRRWADPPLWSVCSENPRKRAGITSTPASPSCRSTPARPSTSTSRLLDADPIELAGDLEAATGQSSSPG